MKNTEKRMLSRKDAAAVLRCSQQTVSNWVESGMLKGHLINGRLFVDADTVHAVTDTVGEIEESKRKIEALRDEYEARRRQLEEELDRKREELHFYKCSTASRVTLRAFASVLMSYGDDMPTLEKDVLLELVKSGDTDYTSQKFDLPCERVLKIADKACRRIGGMQYGKTSKENAHLKQRVEELLNENARLRSMLGRDLPETAASRNPFYDTPLTDCDFCVRTLNCLRTMDVKTVGELVDTPLREIAKQRNVGRKTLSEIEEFMKANGLNQAK